MCVVLHADNARYTVMLSVEYPDIPLSFSFAYIPDWQFLVISTTRSDSITCVANIEVEEGTWDWGILELPETRTAELELDHMTLGVAFDLSQTASLEPAVPDDPPIPPMPLLLFYTTEGLLNPHDLIHNDPDSPGEKPPFLSAPLPLPSAPTETSSHSSASSGLPPMIAGKPNEGGLPPMIAGKPNDFAANPLSFANPPKNPLRTVSNASNDADGLSESRIAPTPTVAPVTASPVRTQGEHAQKEPLSSSSSQITPPQMQQPVVTMRPTVADGIHPLKPQNEPVYPPKSAPPSESLPPFPDIASTLSPALSSSPAPSAAKVSPPRSSKPSPVPSPSSVPRVESLLLIFSV